MNKSPLPMRCSRFPGQNGGLAKVDSEFDYAANFSSFACVSIVFESRQATTLRLAQSMIATS